MPALFLTWMLASCKKDIAEVTPQDRGYTETIFSNPGDNQILEIDSAGRKMILMGPKEASGMPVAITQALVDAPDMDPAHRLLVDFNDDGSISRISNPALGIMIFTYLNSERTLVSLTLPDTLGSYQMSFNPTRLKSSAGGSTPQLNNTLTKSADGGAVITATYENGRSHVHGISMRASYVTSGGTAGIIQCMKGETEGTFSYSIPVKAFPDPPSGYREQAYSLLGKLSKAAIPVVRARETISGSFATLCAGSEIIEPFLDAYAWVCGSRSMSKGAATIVDNYTADKETITITAQHPALPLQSKSVDFVHDGSPLSDVEFLYEANASFANVNTSSSAPTMLTGYTIVARINETTTETVPVRFSIISSDGYVRTEDFQVAPGGSCELFIPGTLRGVRDDITARINPASPAKPGQMVRMFVKFQ